MSWYHYSKDNKLSKKTLYDLESKDHPSYPFKPSGLWLSLNEEWYEFENDTSNQNFIQKYKYEVDFDTSNERILVIDTLQKLKDFDEKYKLQIHESLTNKDHDQMKQIHGGLQSLKNFFPDRFPNWEKVCEDYDGMVCTNYTEILMSGCLIEKMHWWSWLDINCCCMWRPSKVIKDIKLL